MKNIKNLTITAGVLILGYTTFKLVKKHKKKKEEKEKEKQKEEAKYAYVYTK